MKLKLTFMYVLLAAMTLLLTACPGAAVPPTFSLSLDPTTGSAVQGGNTATTATVTPAHGFTGPVAFSLVTPPAGVTLTGGPAAVTGTAPVTAPLTLSVATGVAPGSYPLTVRAP